jgi:hypothetical protein
MLGFWGERRGLNPRPSVPQTDALPAELRSPENAEQECYATSCSVATDGNGGVECAGSKRRRPIGVATP